jgi:hypothetical protein
MDNIYTISNRGNPTNNGTRFNYYKCRLFRTNDYTPVEIAKRQQNRSCRTAIGCPAKLKVVFYGESRVEVSRLGTKDYINKGIENDIGTPARQKLQVREILDELLARYYDLETETETWPDNAQDEAIRKWAKDLDSITGSLQQTAVGELKKELPLESQQAIEAAGFTPVRARAVEGFDYEELEG